MKLSEYIEKLQALQQRHGDMRVLEHNNPGAYVETYSSQDDIWLITIRAKPDGDSWCESDDGDDGEECLVI